MRNQRHNMLSNFKHLVDNQNFVVSPVSALALLSALLVAKGPRGNTAVQICKAVSGGVFDAECEREDFQMVQRNLEKIREGVALARSEGATPVMALANGAFFHKGLEFNNYFVEHFAKFPGDRNATVYFNTSNAMEQINKWVDESSGGLITQLFKNKDEIDADTRLMLLNVVAFKGKFRLTLSLPFRQLGHTIQENRHETLFPAQWNRSASSNDEMQRKDNLFFER